MIRYYFFILLFFALCETLQSQNENIGANNVNRFRQGLYFLSHTVSQEERTGLNLTPDAPLSLTDGFTLDFDIKLRKEFHSYGYVFRIIVNDTLNIDFLSNIRSKDTNFSLIKNNEKLHKEELGDITNYVEKWIKVQIKIDVKNQKILHIAKGNKTLIETNIPEAKKVKINFGASDDKQFYITDVPPMTIRNIQLQDADNKVIRKWNLFKHFQHEVYDETKNKRATAQNPIWEIDKHYKWNKLIDFSVGGYNPQIAYNADDGIIYISKDKHLYKYFLETKTLDSTLVNKGLPYNSIANSIIYNPINKELISYSPDTGQFIKNNLSDNEWFSYKSSSYNTIIHHNQVIARDRNELIIFGGYGYYRYSALIGKHKLDSTKWEFTDLSQEIAPRYLSSAVYAGDGKLFVLGGYGSWSGKQEEFPHTYNDLHLINTDDLSCEKKWEYEDKYSHQVYSNSMIIDKEVKHIYVLAYNNNTNKSYIQLNRFGIDTPDRTILGDTIPFNFYDIESFCNLYLNSKKNELIAAIYYKEKDNQTKVTLYSIAFPPLAQEDIIQQAANDKMPVWNIYIIIFITLLIAFILIYFLYIKKRSKNINDSFVETTKTSTTEDRKHVPSILLLGGFQVLDNEGHDMTNKFTQVLKSLFLFLLLNMLKNGKGVTSQQINETLWPNMDRNSATNNRNVSINKLRIILKDLPQFNIISNKSGYWYLDINEEIFCDYAEMLSLLSNIQHDKDYSAETINKILELGLHGGLLATINDKWIDNYKLEYSDTVNIILSELIRALPSKKNHELLLRIGNVMLAIDNLDENAISIKCHALYHLGKKGLAKQCYINFCDEYRNSLDSSPRLQFNDIIKKNS